MLSKRQQSSLPSNTEPNLRERVKAIILISEKESQYEKPQPKEQEKEEDQKSIQEEVEPTKVEPTKQPPPATVREYTPRIPYPLTLNQTKDKEQFDKFLYLFKQLHINIPFVEALSQMPKYAKFLILSKKRRLEDISTIEVEASYSSIILNKLPPKLKDPGSFIFPCVVGDITVDKALADLGASINLMPYSFFKKLGLAKSKPTRMSLQHANRSVKIPKGIIKNVLVKVRNFIYSIDFAILDMDEDRDVPLILGRPFLPIARALIEVEEGKLILTVGDEELVVKIVPAMKYPLCVNDSCYAIDVVDSLANEHFEEISCKDELDLSSVHGEGKDVTNLDVEAVLK